MQREKAGIKLEVKILIEGKEAFIFRPPQPLLFATEWLSFAAVLKREISKIRWSDVLGKTPDVK